ncbi:MAG TPA: DMT family transporter [Thermoanaerobaculia bacterium]|jgi:transporter family-2 protein
MTSAYLFLIASVAGVAVALQGQVMGAMNRSAGSALAVFVTYGSGGVISAVIWMMRRSPGTTPLTGVPWYGWTAGALGLLIVGGIGFATPRLGLSKTLVITVAAQLGAALAIESFGLFGTVPSSVTLIKVLGVVMTAAGVWLVVR